MYKSLTGRLRGISLYFPVEQGISAETGSLQTAHPTTHPGCFSRPDI